MDGNQFIKNEISILQDEDCANKVDRNDLICSQNQFEGIGE